ncbi:hypothetical protein ACLMJK_000682 [Lecanora helva]
MGPRRRSKPNPKAEGEADNQIISRTPTPASRAKETPPAITDFSQPGDTTQSSSAPTANHAPDTPKSSKSWYGGSWPRKAVPIIQVAKESISAAGGTGSDAVASARAHTPQLPITALKSPRMYLSESKGNSSRSLPLAATTTKLNITSNSPAAPDASTQPQEGPSNTIEGEKTQEYDQGIRIPTDGSHKVEVKEKSLEVANSNRDSAGWLNWFSRSNATRDGFSAITTPALTDEQAKGSSRDRSENITTESTQDTDPPSSLSKHRSSSDPSPVSPNLQQETPSRSWLGLWGNSTTPDSKSANASRSAAGEPSKPKVESIDEGQSQDLDTGETGPSITSQPPLQSVDAGKSYGWAFWSKDSSKGEDGQKATAGHVGELTLVGSSQQSKPNDRVFDQVKGFSNKTEKRQRPQSLDASDNSKTTRRLEESEDMHSKTSTPPVPKTAKSTVELSPKTKRLPDNLLLPSFKHTFRVAARPGLIQQLSRLLQVSSTPEARHLFIAQPPHRIKRVLAIGVHGYFPAPLVRSVLGQPTGTSIRFANGAANAIFNWTQEQNCPCEIEKVALEGEGKIAERIELLWKLTLNWIDKIRKADFVMIACHSQGVPVAVILVAKLIAFGCVSSTRISICAMAGVNLGPFADYKSRWIGGSAGELFDFAQPDSRVSKDYDTALDEVLRFGVKIVYTGSIDDQLVSLDSSTFGTISHPNIYRAVFIDGRIHAPDFLSHLVGFALKLRNLGVSDHGLIRELSTPLAGSLYTGEGHSRIYEDEAVYYLAVQHALETTDVVGNAPLRLNRASSSSTSQNPYILPFAMRGLLEEDYVRSELHGEITELIKQFDDWKPSSKVLKDVKFRLEGVRSKL